jgi:hypothetical protein
MCTGYCLYFHSALPQDYWLSKRTQQSFSSGNKHSSILCRSTIMRAVLCSKPYSVILSNISTILICVSLKLSQHCHIYPRQDEHAREKTMKLLQSSVSLSNEHPTPQCFMLQKQKAGSGWWVKHAKAMHIKCTMFGSNM